MKEDWKDIPGFEGRYKISNYGRVISIGRIETRSNGVKLSVKEKIIKSNLRNGYPYIKLTAEKRMECFRIHRLIAKLFIVNPDNKPHVNHIDGCKTNNRADNLEWVTQSENNFHAYKTGLKTPPRTTPVLQILADGSIVKFNSISEASRILGINKANISSVCLGRKSFKTAGGFHFMFENKKEVA